MAVSTALSRRGVLAGGAGLGIALAAPARLRAGPLARLALHGPVDSPGITLAHAVATGALAGIAAEVSLKLWRTPDELRAGLASGAVDLAVLPVEMAAGLYNRGTGLGLVNAMTDGCFYVVAAGGMAGGLADLAGRRIAVPFMRSTPDVVLRAVLAGAGLGDAVVLVPAGSPAEAAELLRAGRVDAALLSEPAAGVAILRGAEEGRGLRRAIDLQAEWGAVTGLGPVLPQAGLAVTRAFAEAHGEVIAPLHARLAAVAAAARADPVAAAVSAAGPLGQPPVPLARAIPHARLTARPAREVRPAIEAMLAVSDPAITGGGLPGDGFYVL